MSNYNEYSMNYVYFLLGISSLSCFGMKEKSQFSLISRFLFVNSVHLSETGFNSLDLVFKRSRY